MKATEYGRHGLPWFDLYDEAKGDIAQPEGFGQFKSVKEVDKSKGFAAQQDDETLEDLSLVKLPKEPRRLPTANGDTIRGLRCPLKTPR